MIDHNHFICHFIFGGHLLNIPKKMRKLESSPQLPHFFFTHTDVTPYTFSYISSLMDAKPAVISSVPAYIKNMGRLSPPFL